MYISNNVSSIQSHQTMMNTNANNIANVNSGGFIPNDTKMTNGTNQSVIATNRQASDTNSPKSQTDLSKEIPDQIIASDTHSLNATAIKTQDQMMGTLLDIKA
jgi:flagellar hook protein FlgE